MSEQENLRIVNRGYEAFGRGDLDALLDTLADDIEWITPGPAEVATAGRRRGKTQVADFFRILGELFDITSFEPQTFIADKDRVIVLGSEEARFKPTGAMLPPVSWAHAFTVRNGKIVHFQEYLDTAPVVEQLQAARQRA